MADAVVEEHKTVMKLTHTTNKKAHFAQLMDDERPQGELALRTDLWEELGKPDHVTVSVRANDLLNADT